MTNDHAASRRWTSPLRRRARTGVAVGAGILGLLVAPLVLGVTQTSAPWGLDRIDQRTLPLSASYTYNATGAGVTIYVIGTGVRSTHGEFGGRVRTGADFVNDGRRAADDCQGNGTHIAATAAGATYGVAKAATIVPVRVLNCQGSGTMSSVIAGINWITYDARYQRSVVVMPFSNAGDASLDTAVRNLIAHGVTFVSASGNTSTDACSSSPARVPEAITVAATSSTDQRPAWSNFGPCVDLFAPGLNITSAWNTADYATNTISGGSTASAHVAGAAALVAQSMGYASPQQVRDTLINSATPNVVGNAGTGTPNRLLYTLGSSTPPPPPPSPTPTPTCALAESSSGTLSGTGDADVHPNGTYYYSGTSGTHRACLRGPSGVDFDLELHRWSSNGWTRVAASESTTSNESITYSGTPGYYQWRVYSYAGSGSYTFSMQRPG